MTVFLLKLYAYIFFFNEKYEIVVQSNNSFILKSGQILLVVIFKINFERADYMADLYFGFNVLDFRNKLRIYCNSYVYTSTKFFKFGYCESRKN